MKTRNELQKEIDYLVSENNRLQSELDVANNHVQHFQNQILEISKTEYRKNKEIADLNDTNTKLHNAGVESLKQIVEIKSLNLFQLIRWWWDAKN